MGKLQRTTSSKPSPSMDIDPRPSSWNNLCPTYINARRTKLLQQEAEGHVIGSPPSAGPPKVMWNENFPMEVPNRKDPHNTSEDKVSSMDTSELTSRVEDMRLRPPQPMIICETVEDVKLDNNEVEPRGSVSLEVPPVDLSNEKKRPPY